MLSSSIQQYVHIPLSLSCASVSSSLHIQQCVRRVSGTPALCLYGLFIMFITIGHHLSELRLLAKQLFESIPNPLHPVRILLWSRPLPGLLVHVFRAVWCASSIHRPAIFAVVCPPICRNSLQHSSSPIPRSDILTLLQAIICPRDKTVLHPTQQVNPMYRARSICTPVQRGQYTTPVNP